MNIWDKVKRTLGKGFFQLVCRWSFRVLYAFRVLQWSSGPTGYREAAINWQSLLCLFAMHREQVLCPVSV